MVPVAAKKKARHEVTGLNHQKEDGGESSRYTRCCGATRSMRRSVALRQLTDFHALIRRGLTACVSARDIWLMAAGDATDHGSGNDRARSRRALHKTLFSLGSPGRARTADPVINSHLLYRLSYRGIGGGMVMAPPMGVNSAARLSRAGAAETHARPRRREMNVPGRARASGSERSRADCRTA